MTKWCVHLGDIFELQADGLLCSANPSLNLSGGVGGAFAMRYGRAMQEHLHSHLKRIAKKFVEPGSSVIAPPSGSPYRAVAHAVAVDAFYDTSAEIIRRAYASAFELLQQAGCGAIAAACLGCGYGRFDAFSFTDAIRPMLNHPLQGIDVVTICSTNEELIASITSVLAVSDDKA